MIELYAISHAGAPSLRGIAPLRTVAAGDLTAVCGNATEEPLSADVLWRHEETVESLMHDRDLLPVRYGTRFEDEEALARAVLDRREELVAALERVRGAVELSLRVHGPGPPPPDTAARTGTEYLKARIRAEDRRDDIIRTVAGPLRKLARADVRRTPREASELLRAAYLVDREGVEPFRARVAELQTENRELAMLCTGPWPVYSFVQT